jgi:pyruvate/2-oxoglutarate dehydrogenase complex dihydrolipoamide dehydrogenase (E3) component
VHRDFDVIVIGAGPTGEVAAGRLATRGRKRVAIVERRLVGGECSFYACMPSKALLRPAQALSETLRVPGAAQAVTRPLDVRAALDRRDEVINNLDDSLQVPWLEDRGVELFRGPACFDGERRVIVGDDTLTAREAVIVATGSTASMPPIPGLAEVGAWSNREITTAEEAPARLLILGGGVVGVEMAQAWATLGSKVTVIEALDRLIAREEPFASELVADGLRGLDVDLRIGVKATSVSRSGEEVTVELEDGSKVTGDHLLVGVGRKPNTAELGIEQFGLQPGRYIEVDDHLQVAGHPWLYAIGDANGRALLTHAGKYQGRIAADHILGEQGAVAFADAHGLSPRVIFTEPQIAAVGATLEQAQDAGATVIGVDLPTGSSAGATFVGHGAPGTSRFVVDTDREVLLGVTFVGPDVADFLQAASVAVVAELPLTTLAHAIAPFPTRSELWLSFLEEYERQRDVTVHSQRSGK